MASFNFTNGTKSTAAQTLVEDDGATGATATSPGTGGSDDTGTIDSTSSLTTTTSIAVTLNLSAPPASNGIVINNAGTIATTGGSRVIDATSTVASGTNTATGAEITLNNSGTIKSSGGSSSSKGDLFRVNYDMPSGIVNVYNTGTMSAGVLSNDSQGIRLGKVYTASSILIDNGTNAAGATNSGATIVTADADGIRPGGVDPGGTAANIGSSVINNYGTISAHDATTVSGALSAVNGIDISTGQSATVNNMSSGIIAGDESGLGSDVSNGSTTATPVTFASNYNVNNLGTITGYNGDGVASYVVVGTAVTGTATINNSGTIQGEATGKANTDGLSPYAASSNATVGSATGVGVLVGGNASITNNGGGTIQGSGAIGSGKSYGVNVGGGTITNYGTIQDTTSSAGVSGQAILMRDAAGTTNTISNYGTISGSNGAAIAFGSGNDTLNLYTGESISGTVTGGSGTDAVNLAATGSNTTGSITGISSFTSLNVNSGTWTMSDNESYSGGETIAGGANLVLGAAGSTTQVNFANTSTPATLTLSSAAQPTSGGAFGGTLNGFGGANIVDLQNFGYNATSDSVSVSGNTLTVTNASTGQNESFTLANPVGTNFALKSDNANGTDIICFTSGTRIRTTRGEVAVEHLEIADLVVTASGEQRPVKWLGHRTVDCRRHPDPRAVMPIRIAAHAFGPQRPARDLLVSPGHSICIDLCGEVLIPAMRLYNGSTISQVDVERVTYWHVELDGHDILLAENLACESYIDCGTRAFFAETDVVALEALPDAPALTTDDYCRPFHPDGLVVDFARDRLCVRAAELGWRLEVADALGGLWLEVDGRRVEPRCRGLVARALLPADAREVFLCSDSAVPADMHGGKDTRRLGLQFASLTIDDGIDCRREIGCGDPRLDEGFHPHEGALRWTDGRARLPCELWAGCDDDFVLRLAFAGPALPQWVAPAEEDDNAEAAVAA